MNKKIVLLHDWFVTRGGSEKVVAEILELFDISEVQTLFEKMNPNDKASTFSPKTNIKTSILQRLPGLKSYYRYLLPFFPSIINKMDVKNYDVILSSSHCGIKNVKTTKSQIHICYCHTPVRYAWDLKDSYFDNNSLKSKLKNVIIHPLLESFRKWDYKNTKYVTHFIANSQYIADRIKKNYNRTAKVIYPPVDVESFTVSREKEDYYIMANRLVSYKKAYLVAQAFAKMPNKKLIIVGDGPDEEKIKQILTPNIQLLPYPGKEKLNQLIQKAKAFILASDEDFGITPVEAQATGTPTLAYKKGGALEYVIEGKTGYFFEEQTISSIINAVEEYDEKITTLDIDQIRLNAERFSYAVFRKEYKDYISSIIQ